MKRESYFILTLIIYKANDKIYLKRSREEYEWNFILKRFTGILKEIYIWR